MISISDILMFYIFHLSSKVLVFIQIFAFLHFTPLSAGRVKTTRQQFIFFLITKTIFEFLDEIDGFVFISK